MAQNLTNSPRDRQKILNNPVLLHKIEQHLNLDKHFRKIPLNNCHVVPKQFTQRLFDVSTSILNKCIATHEQELEASGYISIKDKQLEEFLSLCDVDLIREITDYKISDYRDVRLDVLEFFPFKAWLNMAMLLSESEPAKFIRSRTLDIVIDTVAEKERNHVRYINWSIEHEILDISSQAIIYSESFFIATKKYLNLDHIERNPISKIDKFCRFGCHYHEIYKLVFGDEYRHCRDDIANNTSSHSLERFEGEREARFNQPIKGYRLCTGLYFEIRKAIFSLEKETAKEIQLLSEQTGRRITIKELDGIVANLEDNSNCKSIAKEAKLKISIINYLYASEEKINKALNKKIKLHNEIRFKTELNDFIAVKTQSLKEKLSASKTMAVFQRLKES